MLIEFFLDTIKWFVNTLFSILPSGPDLPEGLTASFTTLVGYASGLNNIFPVSEIMYSLGFFILFEIAMVAVAGTFWVIKLVRGN